MSRLALACVLVASTPALAAEPWRGSFKLAGGTDSNVLRDPSAREQAFVLRAWGDGTGEPVRDLRLAASGAFEQSTYDAQLNERAGDLRAWYRRALGPRFAVAVSSLSSYRRDLTVFADGQVTRVGATLRTERAQHLLGALALELDDVELEASMRGDVKETSGSEDYGLLGLEAGAQVRWFARPDLALRLRYGFVHRTIDGLSPRNVAGGLAGVSRDLVLGIHRLRGQVRWEPRPGLTVLARYDRASMTDDFTGYYDSVEQDVQLGASIPIGRITRLELLVDHLDRDYLDRVGSVDTPSSDALLELSAEVDVWLFGNFGLTGRYQLERASAEPAGTLYTRHVVLVGAAARLGVL